MSAMGQCRVMSHVGLILYYCAGSPMRQPRWGSVLATLWRQVYGSDTAQQMRGLPLHQKVILCCLHRLRDHAAAITIGKLSTEYGKVCEMKNIAALDQDFLKILTLMECSGLVQITGRKRRAAELREAKVGLRGVADDIMAALKDERVLASLLVPDVPNPGPDDPEADEVGGLIEEESSGRYGFSRNTR